LVVYLPVWAEDYLFNAFLLVCRLDELLCVVEEMVDDEDGASGIQDLVFVEELHVPSDPRAEAEQRHGLRHRDARALIHLLGLSPWTTTCDRSLQCKTDQVKGRVSQINQVNKYASKNDQLLFLYIAVDFFPNERFHLIDF